MAGWCISCQRVDQQAIVMVLCISSHFVALLYVEGQCSETCVAIGCRQTSQSHGADSALYPELLRFEGADTVRHVVCEESCFQLGVGTSLSFIAKCSGTCTATGCLRRFTSQAPWAIPSICRVAVHSMATRRCWGLDKSRVVSRMCKVLCCACHCTYVG